MADEVDVGSLKVDIVIDEKSVKDAQRELDKGIKSKKTGKSFGDAAKEAFGKEHNPLQEAAGKKGVVGQMGDLAKVIGRLVGIRIGGGVGGTVGAAAGGQAGRAITTGLLERFGLKGAFAAAALIVIKEIIQTLAKATVSLVRWSEALADSVRIFSPDIIQADMKRIITGFQVSMREANVFGKTLASTRNELTELRANLRLATLGTRFQFVKGVNTIVKDLNFISKIFRSLSSTPAGFGATMGGLGFLGMVVPGFNAFTGGGLLGVLGLFSPMFRFFAEIRRFFGFAEDGVLEVRKIREQIREAIDSGENQKMNQFMLKEVEHLIGSDIFGQKQPPVSPISPPTFTPPLSR